MFSKRYCLLMREVNLRNGEIFVQACQRGTQEDLVKNISYCHMRSLFNPELSFYITFEEFENEALGVLKEKEVVLNDIIIKL